jgi:predicted TPR repeat methyltransferase
VNGANRGIAAPLVLLLLFVLVIRGLPGLARAAAPPDDCQRTAPTDVAAMERCLALRADDVELMIDLAAAYERAGDSDRAAAIYTRALAVDPADAELRAKLDALRMLASSR